MHRRLSAILSSDVVGYSRAMEIDESETLSKLKSNRQNVIDPAAEKFGGRTIKLMGDGALMEFASAVDAVAFAVTVQTEIRNNNAKSPDDLCLQYRVGINVGDIVVEDDDIFGDGVNISARLQSLAEPGGICISRSVHTQVRSKLDLTFESLGEQKVKNIEEPVPAFKVVLDERADSLSMPETTPSTGRKPVSRRLVAILAVVLLMVAGGLWWATSVRNATNADMRSGLPRLAVMAFDDLSTGDERSYLSDAIAEGLITELSRVPEVSVLARNTSFSYRDAPVNVVEVGRELNLSYLVEGSQQKNGDQLRVTVQLIDATSGEHVWADTYDREIGDLFVVQDEIVRAIAAAVGARVGFRDPPVTGAASVNALHYHLKARQEQRKFTKEGALASLELNKMAVQADPDSHFGYIGLAFSYMAGYRRGWSDVDRDEALRLAEEAAEKALSLDPNAPGAQYARGWVHYGKGELEEAVVHFKKAIELYPSSSRYMNTLSLPLMSLGRLEEAAAVLQEAMELDPHHPDHFKANLAWVQYILGDCETALETYNGQRNPPSLRLRTLATIYICLGREDDAREVIAEFLEDNPDYSITEMRSYLDREYQAKEYLEQWYSDLRIAGMPE